MSLEKFRSIHFTSINGVGMKRPTYRTASSWQNVCPKRLAAALLEGAGGGLSRGEIATKLPHHDGSRPCSGAAHQSGGRAAPQVHPSVPHLHSAAQIELMMMKEKGSKMPRNERTPLIQRVPVDERDRVRYPHTTVGQSGGPSGRTHEHAVADRA